MQDLVPLMYLQFDGITVAAFFGIALFYFIAPVLGYSNSNRLLVVTALGALIVKMGLAFFRISLIHYERFERTGSYSPIGPIGPADSDFRVVTGLLPPLEVAFFILALVIFSLWLFGLERVQHYPETPPK